MAPPGDDRTEFWLMKTPLALLAAALLPFLVAAKTSVEPAPVTLRDFKLTGELTNDHAAFVLSAVAHVESPKGGSLELLSGAVALTELGAHPKWRVDARDGYVL